MGTTNMIRNENTESSSFMTALKSCAQKKDLYRISSIHADIRNSGLLQKDKYLGSALVSTYVKCGALTEARNVVDELLVRNVVIWNALIAGYAQNSCGKEALTCFQQMRSEGLFPDAITYVCILKACGITQDVDMGARLHDEVARQGLLKKHAVLGNALVDMYAKCGILKKAQKVFDGLLVHNVVPWNALIAGYAQHGYGKEALACFQQMQRGGIFPDAITYTCTLKACGITQDVNMGERIHDEIASQGLLKKHVFLGNALVSMYAKCGFLKKAQRVLDELSARNDVSWSILIAGYAQHGYGKEALACFQQMRSEGFFSSATTYVSTLKACGIAQNVDMGERLHDEIARQKMLERHVILGNALVHMYAKCGFLRKAQKVLDELHIRNIVSWNALIAGYAQHGCGKEALICFQRMQSEGLSPDAITYACTLKGCGIMQDVEMGEKIHDQIARQGLLEKHVVLGNALVGMYAKCGFFRKSQRVLDGLPVRNVVSWNALIAGNVQHGCGKEALACFQHMRSEGLSPGSITYLCTLKACGITQNVDMGERIHNEIARQELLKKHVFLGIALANMYAECGVLTKAQTVLNEVPVWNVASWNALIAGYAQHDCGKEALASFQQMRRGGFSPGTKTYACTLKACSVIQDVDMGERIHEEIASQGLLEKSLVLGGALVNMYAKCGILTKARDVHDNLPFRNVVSWNALIAGYAQHGYGMEALACFQQMRSEGLFPDAITYACSLKACGIMQDVDMGKRIHDEIASQGLLEKHLLLGNALVDMYAKCCMFTKARSILDELPFWNCVPWNALIVGYTQHGYGKEALACIQQMCSEGLSPDAITYACTLNACGITQDVDKGERIHIEIARQGMLEKHVVLANALVDMYAKCGFLRKAQKVLDELSNQNVVSWSALIAGYAQHGCGKEALVCFQRMQSEGLFPDAITYVCTLKACAITQDADMGERIHDEIVRQGLLEKHVVLGNALVDMYAKCGFLRKAQKVFDGLPVGNVVSWNALIAGYAQHGYGKAALGCFQQMRSEGLFPDAITYACTLKACGITQDADMGERFHDEIASQGLLARHVWLGNALVCMYAKCGFLRKAQKVLNELTARNAVSWSMLIAGYAHHGRGKEALVCFQQMQSEGLPPNAITYACTLKACGLTQDVGMGERIHNQVASQGLLEEHVLLGNALVDMYAKCGVLTKARHVFDELPSWDVVSWNALIAGYAQHGCGKEALASFEQMRIEGLFPDAITYASTLKACGITQDIDKGEKIHGEIFRHGLLEKHVVLGCALVNLYGKCAFLKKAQKVLDELPARDAASWSALIVGYAQHGCGKEALGCFQRMQQEGTFPDAITFVCVLSACSHSGLVNEGQTFFDMMTEKYGILPEKDHYTCMVDLFGRARHFDKAMRVIKMMPSSDWPPVWCAILGACRDCGNVELGGLAFKRAVELTNCLNQ